MTDADAMHVEDESLVTVEFREVPGGTEITLVHERLPSAEAREGHRQGWDGSFDCLAEYLG